MNNLKKLYESREIEPESSLWERLETKLDNAPPISSSVKPSFGVWKYAAAILLLISVGYLLLNRNPDKNADTFVVEKTAPENPEKKQITQVSKAVTEATTVSEPSENSELKNSKPTTTIAPKIADIKVNLPETGKNNTGYNTVSLKESKEAMPVPEKEVSENIFQDYIVEASPKYEQQEQSYVKADELLFSREINRKRKENRRQTAHLVNFDFSKIPRPKPSSFKILGIEMLNEEASNKN